MEKEDFLYFLEKKPLYTKLNVDPEQLDIPNVNINLFCNVCKDNRTFVLKTKEKFPYDGTYFYDILDEKTSTISEYDMVFLNYECASCEEFKRDFLIQIGEYEGSLRKIGQNPPFSIDPPKELRKLLGKYEEFYKKGRILENFTNGIGAYAYYRRIIEGIINDLLDKIPRLMSGEQKAKFEQKLIKVKEETRAKKKIEIVKDLVPEDIRRGGRNPLQILYEVLSIGIHIEDEDRINDNASLMRETLEYLLLKVIQDEKKDKKYKRNIDTLLKRLEKV